MANFGDIPTPTEFIASEAVRRNAGNDAFETFIPALPSEVYWLRDDSGTPFLYPKTTTDELHIDKISEYNAGVGVTVDDLLIRDQNIGTSAAYQGSAFLTSWSLRGDVTTSHQVKVYSASAGPAYYSYAYRYGGTIAVPAATPDGSVIKLDRAFAYDGTTELEVLRKVEYVSGAVATDNVSAGYQWWVRPPGVSEVVGQVMTLTSAGLYINTINEYSTGYGVNIDNCLIYDGGIGNATSYQGRAYIQGVSSRADGSVSDYYAVYSAGDTATDNHFSYRFGGTIAVPAAAPTDAYISHLRSYAHDLTDYREVARFTTRIEGAVATDNVAGQMYWLIRGSGVSAPLNILMHLTETGLHLNNITEYSTGAGVTIEGIKLEDSTLWTSATDMTFQDDTTGPVTLTDLVSAGEYWGRAGTVLSPITPDDDVDIGSGTFYSTGSISTYFSNETAHLLSYARMYSDNLGHASYHHMHRYGGTIAVPTAAPSNAYMQFTSGHVYDGTSLLEIVRFSNLADGAIATDNAAGRYLWSLRPTGVGETIESRMELNQLGLNVDNIIELNTGVGVTAEGVLLKDGKMSLDYLGNPTQNNSISMANFTHTWLFAAPAGGMLYSFIGAASGHLVEMIQQTGVPSAGTHLLHIQAASSNVDLLHLQHGASTNNVIEVDVTSDANYRFIMNAAGRMDWGDGTAIQDTYIYRNGNNLTFKDNTIGPVTLTDLISAGEYWDRTGTALSPITSGDDVELDGNIYLNTDVTVSHVDKFIYWGDATDGWDTYIVEDADDRLRIYVAGALRLSFDNNYAEFTDKSIMVTDESYAIATRLDNASQTLTNTIYSATASHGVSFNSSHYGGVRSATLVTPANSGILLFRSFGYDGSALTEVARYSHNIVGTPAAGDVSGEHTWHTRAGTGSLTERMSLTQDGHLYLEEGLYVDTITERVSAAGVTIEGTHFKDNLVGIGATAASYMLSVYNAVANDLILVESGDAGAFIEFKDDTTVNLPYVGAVGQNLQLRAPVGVVYIDTTLEVDAINEYGSGQGVTVEGTLMIDSNIGTASQYQGTTFMTQYNQRADSISTSNYTYLYSATSGHAHQQYVYRYGGTLAAPVVVPSNSYLNHYRGYAYDGAVNREITRYSVKVDGAVASDNVAGEHHWLGRAAGVSETLVNWMGLDQAGLQINTIRELTSTVGVTVEGVQMIDSHIILTSGQRVGSSAYGTVGMIPYTTVDGAGMVFTAYGNIRWNVWDGVSAYTEYMTLDLNGVLRVDTMKELTTDEGVTIESIKIEDGTLFTAATDMTFQDGTTGPHTLSALLAGSYWSRTVGTPNYLSPTTGGDWVYIAGGLHFSGVNATISSDDGTASDGYHITIQAGEGRGAGNDAGSVTIKAGDSTEGIGSVQGGIYLMPGSPETVSTVAQVYLGDSGYTGNAIGIQTIGSQTDVDLTLSTKGAGIISVNSAAINLYNLGITDVASVIKLVPSNATYTLEVAGAPGPTDTTGGDLTLHAGAGNGTGDGGNLYLYPGLQGSGGNRGYIYFGTGAAGYLLEKGAETNIVAYDTTTGQLNYRSVSSISGTTPIDNILDWNGTAYAPYAAQQNGVLYSGVTNPVNGTARLNFDGEFYAYNLYAANATDHVTITSGGQMLFYTGGANQTIFQPFVSDGAGAFAYFFDTENTMAIAGSRIATFKNNGSEILGVHYAGVQVNGQFRLFAGAAATSTFYGDNADGVRLQTTVVDASTYATIYAYDDDDGGTPAYADLYLGTALTTRGIIISGSTGYTKVSLPETENTYAVLCDSNGNLTRTVVGGGVVNFLRADGTWATPAGSGAGNAAGSDHHVQFNDGGTAFGGHVDFQWIDNTHLMLGNGTRDTGELLHIYNNVNYTYSQLIRTGNTSAHGLWGKFHGSSSSTYAFAFQNKADTTATYISGQTLDGRMFVRANNSGSYTLELTHYHAAGNGIKIIMDGYTSGTYYAMSVYDSTPTLNMYVLGDGDIYSVGDITGNSDIRYKNVLGDIPFTWDKYMDIETIRYERIERPGAAPVLGFNAQQIGNLWGEVLAYNPKEDRYALKHNGIIAINTVAIQKVKSEVDKLTERVEELEDEIVELRRAS